MRLRARGRAAPPVVWDRYLFPAKWPDWAPQIRRVETDQPRLIAGMTGTVRGPLGVSVRFQVLDVDQAAMSWAWRVWLGPVSFRLHHAVRRTSGGCETTLEIQGFGPFVAAYAPVAQLALVRLVRP